jgi:hypothetical protein
MRAIIVNHRQFKIAVERCGRNRVPIHDSRKAHAFRFGPDPDQKSPSGLSRTARCRTRFLASAPLGLPSWELTVSSEFGDRAQIDPYPPWPGRGPAACRASLPFPAAGVILEQADFSTGRQCKRWWPGERWSIIGSVAYEVVKLSVTSYTGLHTSHDGALHQL